MSCPDYVLSAAGRQGVGVNQPPGGLNYPLILPSSDVRYLIADFYLAYEDLEASYQLPFRIFWLYGLGCLTATSSGTPTHAADVVVVDANNTTVFDSTAATYFREVTWSSDYKLYEWRHGTQVCRLLQYVTWPEGDTPAAQNYPVEFEPASAILDGRSLYRLPPRVTSLTALVDTLSGTPVTFVCGYNLDIQTKSVKAGLRNRTQLIFSAIPGAGNGIKPGCLGSAADAIYTINDVAPDKAGNFQLGANDCYYVRQPIATFDTVVPNTLRIGNDCTACCSCDAMEQFGENTLSLWGEYLQVSQDATKAATTYNTNVERWNAAAATYAMRSPLRLSTAAREGYLEIGGQLVNQTNTTMRSAVLKFVITTSSLPGTEVPNYTIATDDNGNQTVTAMSGGWPTFQQALGDVKPGSYVSVRFRLSFPNNGTPMSVPINTTTTLTATLNGDQLGGHTPISVTKSNTLGGS